MHVCTHTHTCVHKHTCIVLNNCKKGITHFFAVNVILSLLSLFILWRRVTKGGQFYIIWVYYRYGCPEKQNEMCVHIYMCMYVWRDWDWEKLRWELGIYFKELAHMVVEAWQVRNLQGKLAGWDPGKSLSLSPEAVCWQSSFLLEVVSLFLLKPSSDQICITHVMESNLFM